MTMLIRLDMRMYIVIAKDVRILVKKLTEAVKLEMNRVRWDYHNMAGSLLKEHTSHT